MLTTASPSVPQKNRSIGCYKAVTTSKPPQPADDKLHVCMCVCLCLGCRHTSRFLVIWLAFLPFTLWRACHWVMVPAAVLIAFLLLGVEEIGVQIEEPFGILPLGTTNLPFHDIPLWDINTCCRHLELTRMLSQSFIQHAIQHYLHESSGYCQNCNLLLHVNSSVILWQAAPEGSWSLTDVCPMRDHCMTAVLFAWTSRLQTDCVCMSQGKVLITGCSSSAKAY